MPIDKKVELTERFNIIDTNGSGALELAELEACFGEHAGEFLQFCDKNTDKAISAEEFVTGITDNSEGMSDEDFKAQWLDRMSSVIEEKQLKEERDFLAADLANVKAAYKAGAADPISLHLKFGLKEGKTIEDLKKLYDAEVEVVRGQPGCLHFQMEVTQDAIDGKCALLTEKYVSAAAHLQTNMALAAAGLVEGPDGIFATYDFVEMKFGLSETNYTDDYKGLLSQFEQVTDHKPVVIIHDFNGKCMKSEAQPAEGSQHIVLTATVGLKEGKTMADIKALWAKEVEVANKVDGVLHFWLEMNDESMASKTAVLHEVYTGWEGHVALNVALAEAGLVEGADGIFATYDFQAFQFSLWESDYTDTYKGLFSQFEQATGHAPIVDIHDWSGKVGKPCN
jgi:quinol monooxygenase YgiN